MDDVSRRLNKLLGGNVVTFLLRSILNTLHVLSNIMLPVCAQESYHVKKKTGHVTLTADCSKTLYRGNTCAAAHLYGVNSALIGHDPAPDPAPDPTPRHLLFCMMFSTQQPDSQRLGLVSSQHFHSVHVTGLPRSRLLRAGSRGSLWTSRDASSCFIGSMLTC